MPNNSCLLMCITYIYANCSAINLVAAAYQHLSGQM
ncbi:hypothetical protein SLEP1_g45031 [Rubroshorea leprosula]|uniref:Uncharacterized protein n=1 Tax=Rubroshorea leprosula TaxID=152421 RepID=A0AAV5LHY2_9ROSI|nr:hypothetical protein SLEP1_g45031 [Rubroshorea leprosula]